MCRFVLYSGPTVTLHSLLVEPCNSLIHQSFHSYESREPLNGDGFGIAWYVPRLEQQPGQFRSTSPAWSNRNLTSLSRVTDSECILAHVRAASSGLAISEENCHPFVMSRYAFMHNGEVGAFRRVRRHIIEALSDRAFNAIRGTTDSEHVFAMLLDELRFAEHEAELNDLVEAVRRTIRRIEAIVRTHAGDQPSYLNFAVTDGHRAVVSRYVSHGRTDAASLHYSVGSRYECHRRACRMVPADPGDHAVIVSSEPLSRDGVWRDVPVNHLVAVDADRAVKLIPI
ncbi:MAG: class II glutamine amidotransferase [Phycisphaerales bacterium]|nr:class II glutamine amidotransferase [Phycisphaerales bacterium]MCB9856984.1 class II glutamine amidotransferase [Phycisphaerales bacterium]MCB9861889.1 class II glutamine amidotransferase [Phycisphaerales bacterium]